MENAEEHNVPECIGDIVYYWLKENKYDGLVCEYCMCTLDDGVFMCCDEPSPGGCMPARLVNCKSDDCESCGVFNCNGYEENASRIEVDQNNHYYPFSYRFSYRITENEAD